MGNTSSQKRWNDFSKMGVNCAAQEVVELTRNEVEADKVGVIQVEAKREIAEEIGEAIQVEIEYSPKSFFGC